MIKTMTADDLQGKLLNQEVLLIDVREPEEHQEGCIAQAQLIPLAEISCAKLPQTGLPIVIHCHSGKRSMTACRKLLAEDPTLQLYNLDGGIMAWEESGYEIQC